MIMKLFLICLYCWATIARVGCDSHENGGNYSSLLDKMDELSLTVVGLTGRLNKSEETTKKLQSKLIKAKAEVLMITNELGQNLNMVQIICELELNSSVEHWKAENTYLKTQVDSLNKNNRLLTNEIVDLRKEIGEMKNSTEASLGASNKVINEVIEILKKEFSGLKRKKKRPTATILLPNATSEPATTTTTSPPPNEWITIQRRGTQLQNGLTRQTFNLGWVEFANGFGNSSNNDFWLGLNKIAQLTKNGDTELRVDLIRRFAGPSYATYTYFHVSNATDDYRLSVSGFSGKGCEKNLCVDALGYSNNMKFSTKDHDNDMMPYNCAHYLEGGWWHKYCSQEIGIGTGPTEFTWGLNMWSRYNDVDFAEMKIRRRRQQL